MTQFIKLTECKGKIVILNTARIEHIQLGTKGSDTYIKMLGEDNYFFVKESVDDIWASLMMLIENVTYDVDTGKAIINDK